MRGQGQAAAAACDPTYRPLCLLARLPTVLKAGVVTTLVTEEELPALLTMAAELGVAVEQQAPLPPELPAVGEAAEPGAEPAVDVEAARRGLEDLFNLY